MSKALEEKLSKAVLKLEKLPGVNQVCVVVLLCFLSDKHNNQHTTTPVSSRRSRWPLNLAWERWAAKTLLRCAKRSVW